MAKYHFKVSTTRCYLAQLFGRHCAACVTAAKLNSLVKRRPCIGTRRSMVFIAALDVGTTSVRCFILDENCKICGRAQEPVELINPQAGYFEIEPEALWRQIVLVINNSIKSAGLKPQQLTCLTICTQRCTFLTWNHRTQRYYHNFITWKDLRANTFIDKWNNSYKMKFLNTISYGLYLLTQQKRFLAGSVIKLMNGQIIPRFMSELQRNTALENAIKQGEVRLELLDSWILYKLRSGNGREVNVEHITDVTSATATGAYDPFTLGWSTLFQLLFKFDIRILPKIVDNSYKDFGFVHSECFGSDWEHTNLPIACSLSDQAASIWGSNCFNEGDVKITIGTGAFLNLITGNTCEAFVMGMYPLVAWQFDNTNPTGKANQRETVFCVEGAAHDMGTIITWAQSCGIIDNVEETATIAQTVPDSNGVWFIPAFSGLGPPINDHKAASGFIGITPSATKAHMVRAILESIVFRLVQLCQTTEKEIGKNIMLLRVDGGVSRNDFICQFLANASGIRVERAQNAESSVLGATFMAGRNVGLWDMEDIRRFRKIERYFEPQTEMYDNIQARMTEWCNAIDRFSHWYG